MGLLFPEAAFLFLLFLPRFLGNDHIDSFGQHFKVEGRVVEVFSFGFHFQRMWRDGNNVDFLPPKRLYLIDFIDKTAIVDIFTLAANLNMETFLMSVTSNKPSSGMALGMVIMPPPLKRPMPMERLRI